MLPRRRGVSPLRFRFDHRSGALGAQQDFAERRSMFTIAGCYKVLKNAARSAFSLSVNPMSKRTFVEFDDVLQALRRAIVEVGCPG